MSFLNHDELSKEFLHDMFEYREGHLYWKVSPKYDIKVGDRAGLQEVRGYWIIKIFGKKYKAHRLIFLYHHGYLPKFIDHINNDRIDNRIENLRVATRAENNQNARIRKDNKSGIKGVSYNSATKKWLAQLQHNKNRICEKYDTLEEAKIAIQRLRMIYHKDFQNNGAL